MDTITKKLDRVIDSVHETNGVAVAEYGTVMSNENVEVRLARLEEQLLGTSESVEAILKLLRKGQVMYKVFP